MMQRLTIQRQLVIDALKEINAHPTPEEVYECVHQKHPTVSRSTVYRNLNVLEQDGYVYRVKVPDGADHIDLTLNPHYHIVCQNCGHVEDVDLPYFNNITDQIEDASGFSITGHDLVFRGLCPLCK